MKSILIKTPDKIELMAEAGRELAEVLRELRPLVVPGVTTNELDAQAEKFIRGFGSTPAFLNYRPHGAARAYPKTLCVSLNATIVHGLPSEYVVKEGDLVKLDLGLIYKKFYSDAAITIGVGKISPDAAKLISVTEEALALGVKAAKAGATTGDIGATISACAQKNGFTVADSLTGHGIGYGLHEDPYVPNFGAPGKGDRLEVGMVIAIEPMVVTGSGRVRQEKDDSFVTADGSLAAHFEHTVAITERGPRVLTL